MSPSTFVGIDPASGDFECAFIRNGGREATYRTFTITVTELDRMIEWIEEEKIDVVAIEGSGGYTRPLERDVFCQAFFPAFTVMASRVSPWEIPGFYRCHPTK